ncbi:MAG: hypothetical protein N3A62_10195, partial [Thermodesulfovibrionales bacterium]|nr:hypothetical protein [Thermodesulfovibrionales bacterium]
IRVLGPQDRDSESITQSLSPNPELIDVLHMSLILWSMGKNDDIAKILNETGYGHKEVFFKVAQAVSECLPIESKEKKWLDGFLSGKDRLIDSLKKQKAPKQMRLI